MNSKLHSLNTIYQVYFDIIVKMWFKLPIYTSHYATGFRPVSVDYFNTYGDLANSPLGAAPWIHPTTGAIQYGAYNRPGVDIVDKWPHMPSANYMDPTVASYNIGDADAPDIVSLTNNSNREEFDHASGTMTLEWDISETLAFHGHYGCFLLANHRHSVVVLL